MPLDVPPDVPPDVMLTGPADEVAPRLLGWTLCHESAAGTVCVELTEVEAYLGSRDPASHAYRAKTPRNEVMFGDAGHLYVYRSHGLHWCCNVVTGPTGEASAVLLRAGRVIAGMEIAQTRRGDSVRTPRLARGPGCLCRAMGIDGRHNGVDLLGDGPLRLSPGRPVRDADIASGPRVGVSRAHEQPWRFWLAGDPTVSAYRRHPGATRPL